MYKNITQQRYKLWPIFLLLLCRICGAATSGEWSARVSTAGLIAQPAATQISSVNSMRIRDGFAMSGQQITIYVDVNNQEPFHSFQCDITFPTQATVITSTISLTARQQDQTLNWSLLSGNTYRFIGVSGSRTPFSGQSGPVLQVDCVLTGAIGSYPTTLSQVTLVNESWQNIVTGYYSGAVTIYTTPAQVRVRVWLEGLYTTGAMNTALRANGLLPTTSPYWLSARTATAVPANISDWVLLELRSSATGSARQYRAYLLTSSGYLCDMDGVTTNLDLHMPTGSYYLVLRHRNHVSVMSASPQTMDGLTVPTYDFTDNSSQYYGQAAALLSDGSYAMPAGELDSDGLITSRDYVKWYKKKRIMPARGYYAEDLNGDGYVNNGDYLLWKNSAAIGARTAVPQ